jgi:hypothetical protein
MFAPEGDESRHVLGTATAPNEPRAPVYHAVEDCPGFVVARVARPNELPAKRCGLQ